MMNKDIKRLFYSVGIISITYILLLALNLDSQHIKEEKIISTNEMSDFEKAFKKYRTKYGPNDRFRWNGNWYNTNYKEELD